MFLARFPPFWRKTGALKPKIGKYRQLFRPSLNQSSLEEHHAHRKTCNQHVKGGDAADDEAMRQNFQRVWVLEDLFRPPAEQNQVLGMMSFKCPEFLSVPSLAANLSLV